MPRRFWAWDQHWFQIGLRVPAIGSDFAGRLLQLVLVFVSVCLIGFFFLCSIVDMVPISVPGL